MSTRDWPMQEIVRLTGTTSRTLRHYQQVGLLEPSRIGRGGQRFYDRTGLLRLQRILVLRELGLGLPEIGRVLAESVDLATALREHAAQLDLERERLARVAASVRATLTMIETGGELVTETMFDGFDHTQHREEVEQRWGPEAYARADRWWRSVSEADRRRFQQELTDIVDGFAELVARGADAADPATQELTGRLHTWVSHGWGGRAPEAEAFTGLGELYVADPRFGKTFSRDGVELAPFVRDAMREYARTVLR